MGEGPYLHAFTNLGRPPFSLLEKGSDYIIARQSYRLDPSQAEFSYPISYF